jgi:hypothetical protein
LGSAKLAGHRLVAETVIDVPGLQYSPPGRDPSHEMV